METASRGQKRKKEKKKGVNLILQFKLDEPKPPTACAPQGEACTLPLESSPLSPQAEKAWVQQ